MKNFKNLMDFTAFFKTEKKCHEYLKSILWSESKYCPFCGSTHINEYKSNFKKNRCYDCKKDFSIRKGTIFDDSRLSLQKWFMCIFLINSNKKGISSCQLANQVGITQKTAWFVLQRIREACKSKDFNEPFGGNIIEVDEAYFGGKEQNRHMKDRIKGVKKKAVVIGLIDRENKKVRAIKVEDAKANTLQNEIYDRLKEGDILITDESKAYHSISNFRFNHQRVNHSQDEYVKQGFTNKQNEERKAFKIHTNSIEGFWSHLKRGINGTYHWVSHKHIQRYCNEFGYKYDTRCLQNNERFIDFLEKINNTKVKYKDLIS